MNSLLAHRGFLGAMPWDSDSADLAQPTLALLPLDALAMGLIVAQRPRPDEILFLHGWPPQDAAAWSGDSNPTDYDSLFQAARKKGLVLLNSQQSAPAFGPFKHLILQFIPQSPTTGLGWWTLIARQSAPFSPLEQELVACLLQRWAVLFNQTDDPTFGRLLLGHDDRLIHTDPWTRIFFLHYPDLLNQIIDRLHTVVAQRWNNPADHADHDFVIDAHHRHFWVRFRRAAVLPSPNSSHWHLQLLQLHPDELPPLGRLEDDRIAQAVAYIHDHFHQSPRLADIAHAVQLSPFHFHRLFMKHVGISPKHYLQLKQLQVARWMLRSSRASIGTISARCGFSSHGHFTSTFTRMMKLSPSRYRETH